MMHTANAANAIAEIRLWPHEPPGTPKRRHEEVVTYTDGCRLISGIDEPLMEIHQAPHPNGTCAIVIPGGAYTKLVIDKEGTELAHWLNTLGITACVLKHRLPCEGHSNGYLVPMQDAQRAVRILRARAAEFTLDPSRIGVLGASSGAHLAASLATCYADDFYSVADVIDTWSARPDFLIALYGAYTGNRFFTHRSTEQLFFPEAEKNRLYARFDVPTLVTSSDPPSFLVSAENDSSVSPENSTSLYLAMRRAKIAVELHIYHDGGHGFALRANLSQCVHNWPTLCANWLYARKLIAENQ